MKIKKMIRPARVMGAVAAAISMFAATSALADESWPQNPVKVYVPYTAGGPVDTVTRLLMEHVAKSIDQTIIIENKPGANTQISTAQLARATPDGYTFGVVPVAYTTNQVLFDKQLYQPSDFTAVSHIVDIPLFLFVPKDLPVNNVKELADWSRENKPSYASTGVGSTGHLLGESFAMTADFEGTHVAYNGSAQAMPNLITGLVSYFFDPATGGMPHVESGKLKVLAVSLPERCECAPDVPTMAESGYPDIVQSSWIGLLAPSGTPDAIVQRMSSEIAKALRQPEFVERLQTMGFGAVGSTPEELQALIDRDLKVYGEIARKANISLTN